MTGVGDCSGAAQPSAPPPPMQLWLRPDSVDDAAAVQVHVDGQEPVCALLQAAVRKFGHSAFAGVGTGQLQALNGTAGGEAVLSNRARVADAFEAGDTVVVRQRQVSPPPAAADARMTQESPQKKPKSKRGALCAATVVTLCAGAAAWYFTYGQQAAAARAAADAAVDAQLAEERRAAAAAQAELATTRGQLDSARAIIEGLRGEVAQRSAERDTAHEWLWCGADEHVRCTGELSLALATAAVAVVGAISANVARGKKGLVMAHQRDFDNNGVLYWIATQGGTQAWQNPHTAGRVVVTASSRNGGDEANVVGHRNCGLMQTTNSEAPGSWIAVDLKNHRLCLTNYTLRNRNDCDSYHLRHWDVEGSNDGAQWQLLDRRTGDASLVGVNETTTFAANSNDAYLSCRHFRRYRYRYFRVKSTGVDSGDQRVRRQSHFVTLGGLELYGRLTVQG